MNRGDQAGVEGPQGRAGGRPCENPGGDSRQAPDTEQLISPACRSTTTSCSPSTTRGCSTMTSSKLRADSGHCWISSAFGRASMLAVASLSMSAAALVRRLSRWPTWVSTVLGVDSSAALLAELAGHAVGRPAVRTVHGDALDALADLAAGSVDIVACMGDTVLHLPTVMRLATDCGHRTAPRWIDGADLPRHHSGARRSPPAHPGPQHRQPDHAVLPGLRQRRYGCRPHVICTRAGNGWEIHKSSYPKLRLDPAWLADQLRVAGLHVEASRAEHEPLLGDRRARPQSRWLGHRRAFAGQLGARNRERSARCREVPPALPARRDLEQGSAR